MSSDTHWNFRSAREEDWPEVRGLLAAANLPLDGAEDHLACFIIAEADGELVGCAGLEMYGEIALLRSCAVDASHRDHGMGRKLIRQCIDIAMSRGVRELILLTTTAEDYFLRLGFRRIERHEIAEAPKASQEFLGACPASACAMRFELNTTATTSSTVAP